MANDLKDWEKPETTNTDKVPTYRIAIRELQKASKLADTLVHRSVRGLKTLEKTYATIKSFEVMRALRKGQAQAGQRATIWHLHFLTDDKMGIARPHPNLATESDTSRESVAEASPATLPVGGNQTRHVVPLLGALEICKRPS